VAVDPSLEISPFGSFVLELRLTGVGAGDTLLFRFIGSIKILAIKYSAKFKKKLLSLPKFNQCKKTFFHSIHLNLTLKIHIHQMFVIDVNNAENKAHVKYVILSISSGDW
jgi:hypothetical protein